MRFENVASVEVAATMYQQLDAGQLTAQQIGVRAVIHALEFLLKAGVNEGNVRAMVDNSNQQLFAIHEVAHKRCIQLPGYQ